MGDNFIVIYNKLKNEDPSYIIICNKPLHKCEETFELMTRGICSMKGKWYLEGYGIIGQQANEVKTSCIGY